MFVIAPNQEFNKVVLNLLTDFDESWAQISAFMFIL